MLLRLLILAVFWLLSGSSQTFAQSCNFSITNINFGSLNLGLGGTPPTSGTFSATCTGKPSAVITICPNLGEGTGGTANGSPRFMTFGTSSVPYDLYQANGQVWGSYVWPYPPRPPILSLNLDSSGNGTMSQTIDAAITGTAATSLAGTYASVYSANHTLVDYGYAPGQSCTVQSARASRPAFTVSALNAASCNISATTMSFGILAALNSDQAASNQIGITCTRGVKYAVGLSLGINAGSGASARYMANPATGQKIQYGIYQNAAKTQPWGNALGIDTAAGTGTGLTQNLIAFGVIPAQTTPSSGTYSDVVVVTVNY